MQRFNSHNIPNDVKRVRDETSKMTTVYQTGLLLSWLFLALEGPVAVNGQGKPGQYP